MPAADQSLALATGRGGAHLFSVGNSRARPVAGRGDERWPMLLPTCLIRQLETVMHLGVMSWVRVAVVCFVVFVLPIVCDWRLRLLHHR